MGVLKEKPTMFVASPQATLYCTAYGAQNAPAILGIGGWIGSGELWALPFETLSQGWRTISYDHRGSGASVAASDSITLANLVNDVFAVMDAHGLERCVLAAESSGALMALSAALQQPERISGLVIVDGMVFRGLDPAADPFLKGLQHAYSATLDRFVDLCMPDDGPAHIKRWGRQIIDRAPPEAAIALRQANNQADIRDDLPNIKQPTLIIHCDGDKIVPVEQARRLASALPNAELVVFKDSGHIPTMTRPVDVADQVLRFFARRRTFSDGGVLSPASSKA
jgi:pimeloyl-ACP methyl ester carboxylesterase